MKKIIMVLTALVAFTGLTFGQEVTQKKDLTLFDISFFKDSLDRGVVDSVDAKIREVFVNMGRFNVIGLDFRLDAINVQDFVAKIKKQKEETTSLPKEVQFGEKLFTLEEYNKLVGSFIVVIPQITNFTVSQKSNKEWEASVETSFTFNHGSDMSPIQVANITSTSSDKNKDKAIRDAVGQIPMQLTYEIRKIEEFQIKSGIVDLKNGDAVIELGKNMGIQVGDEYKLQALNKDFGDKDEVGLLQIKDVRADRSIARIVYGDATLGAPVQEIARFGVDIEGYALYGNRSISDSFGSVGSDTVPTVGIKLSLARFVYDFRPTASFDYTFGKNEYRRLGFLGTFIVPINTLVGGDYYLQLGRLDIKLGASVGATAVYIPVLQDEPVGYSHLVGQAHAGVNLLIHRDVKLTGDLGYRLQFAKDSYWYNYSYAFAGASIIYKY